MLMNSLFNRVFSDYLMPSQLPAYEELIRVADVVGYTQTSVRACFEALQGSEPVTKVLVHRHDIDTDLRTTRKMFEIEQKYGIKATYYFRLSTLDFGLMRAIEEYGSEASYHYEELASFAKQYRIKEAARVLEAMPDIRTAFANNFDRIERQLGHKMTTVASHGDFANRRLKLNNTAILQDQPLRTRCGIVCESYDRALLDHFDIYIADRPHPQYFHPVAPLDALRRHARICLLTHPRQWETNWLENTKDNLFRLYEGLNW